MAKTFGFGTALKKGDAASPEVFTAVAYVSNISISGYSVDTVEVTTHDSADGFKEYIAGLADGGEVSFDVVFDPSNSTHNETTGGLKAFMDAKTVVNWKVEFPLSPVKTWAFSGFLTSFELEAPLDDALAGSMSIKVTGKPVLS
jgi:predicted secreted protein